MSNNATKAVLKNAAGVVTSDFAKKTDLGNSKSDVVKLKKEIKKCTKYFKVDKLHIGKLETTPVDLSKLTNIVKNDVVKMTEYEK